MKILMKKPWDIELTYSIVPEERKYIVYVQRISLIRPGVAFTFNERPSLDKVLETAIQSFDSFLRWNTVWDMARDMNILIDSHDKYNEAEQTYNFYKEVYMWFKECFTEQEHTHLRNIYETKPVKKYYQSTLPY